MEVHHPHHPTHKKKWSEYIIEFVMLFAAVTLGFFAENVREHQIIEQKTHQNLRSVVLDLKEDSIFIQARIKEYENASIYLDKLNDLYLEYQNNTLPKDEYLDKVLLISDSLIFGNSFYINNSSYKNTIASGSFSNINSTELKRTISNYYEVLGTKLNDNNMILDDVAEYYMVNTLPKPGGLVAPIIGRMDKKKIEIKDYLNDIYLNFSELFKQNNIISNFEVASFKINIDEAMYIGLIVTELYINSIKHAFQNQEYKQIDFNFELENKQIIFNYQDNGELITNKLSPKPTLIHQLCRQLEVDCSITSTKGFQFTFTKSL